MKLEIYNPDLIIDENYFLWRYMPFNKLSTLIEKNELYFARLDTFQDPLEGLTLNDRDLLSSIRSTKDPHALIEFKKQFENRRISKSTIRKWQNGLYASCWYLSKYRNDESIAMWDLFTDKESFAICINFKVFKALLESSLAILDDNEIIGAKYGKIEYLGLYDHSMKVIHSTGTSMPGFIKSPSYNHENEVRFMLLRGNRTNSIDRVGISIKFSENLKQFTENINIYTHPDMNLNSAINYIGKFNDLGFNAYISKVLTKNNIKEFLCD